MNKTINEVEVIIDVSIRDEIACVIRKWDRIIALMLVFGKETINIISIYAHQVGLKKTINIQF